MGHYGSCIYGRTDLCTQAAHSCADSHFAVVALTEQSLFSSNFYLESQKKSFCIHLRKSWESQCHAICGGSPDKAVHIYVSIPKTLKNLDH